MTTNQYNLKLHKMRRGAILLLFIAAINMMGNAQERIRRFQISGYKAVFIPSDTFSIKIGHPELGNIKKSGDSFSLTLKDPQGKMPKDTVWIYTAQVRSINMNFSEIYMDKPMNVDSLSISTNSSHGFIHVEADYLKVSAKSGSHLSVKGEANHFIYQIKGYSSLDTNQLQTTFVQEIEYIRGGHE